jgi:hypothetical protein
MSVQHPAKARKTAAPDLLPGVKLTALSVIKVGIGTLGFMAVALTLSLLN